MNYQLIWIEEVKAKMVAPYHPQSQEAIEVFYKNVQRALLVIYINIKKDGN